MEMDRPHWLFRHVPFQDDAISMLDEPPMVETLELDFGDGVDRTPAQEDRPSSPPPGPANGVR
jgi:hypothetical protein